MALEINVGVLFSTAGSYGAVGQALQSGARMAIDEVNADLSAQVRLNLVCMDPGGDTQAYATGVQSLLTAHDITHVIGCYTSSSRKEVLPLFEKHDAMLWYPSHYEGFETSENVIYTGASPNQHIIPLARYLLEHHGKTGWLVGSNYVWAWENNRILRETLMQVDGRISGERYFPVGETDLEDLVEQILDDAPDFIFMTLIGESAYAFFRLMRQAAQRRGIDQARALPIASCSLSEAELPYIGEAATGHLCSSVYFSTVDTPENHRFAAEWDRRFPHLGHASADGEASYTAVHLLARAIARAGTDRFEDVREAARGLSYLAPQGRVTIDPDNLHCRMRPRIGRSTQDGRFDLLFEEAAPIWPDPYLVWTGGSQGLLHRRNAGLRVVN